MRSSSSVIGSKKRHTIILILFHPTSRNIPMNSFSSQISATSSPNMFSTFLPKHFFPWDFEFEFAGLVGRVLFLGEEEQPQLQRYGKGGFTGMGQKIARICGKICLMRKMSPICSKISFIRSKIPLICSKMSFIRSKYLPHAAKCILIVAATVLMSCFRVSLFCRCLASAGMHLTTSSSS